LLRDKDAALPERHPPGNQVAEFLVFIAGQCEPGPAAEQAGFTDVLLEREGGVLSPVGTAGLDAQRQRGTCVGIPLHIEADSRPVVGLATQFSLVGIALVEARREALPALFVQIERKDFLNFRGRCLDAARKRAERHRQQEEIQSLHDGSVGAIPAETRSK
jgi:hypothetical protein